MLAAPQKTCRALELVTEKGALMWLTVTIVPLQEMGFTVSKREFCDALKLHYDWPIDDLPFSCVCGEVFTVDHAVIGR